MPTRVDIEEIARYCHHLSVERLPEEEDGADEEEQGGEEVDDRVRDLVARVEAARAVVPLAALVSKEFHGLRCLPKAFRKMEWFSLGLHHEL